MAGRIVGRVELKFLRTCRIVGRAACLPAGEADR